MDRRLIRTTAALAIAAFVLTACGQKPGVHVEGGVPLAAPGALDAAGGAEVGGEESSTDPFGGDASGVDAGGDDGTASGSDGGTTDGATSGQGGATPAATGGGTTSGTGGGGGATGGPQPVAKATTAPKTTTPQFTPKGSDRTGAGPDKLTFASHAPVTGAAPLPTTSFEKAGDLYWRDLTERQGRSVLGRKKVELIFRDDKYEPSSARQVCRELAAVAFTVSGGGGTDQIQACGQFAGVQEFPYFSAGVTEAGLRDNPWYFASSMTYRQQGRLLAQYLKRNPNDIATLRGNPKIAAVFTDTPNFDDAVAGWEEGVAAQGLNYYKTLRHPKGGSGWHSDFVEELQKNDVEVLYILSSPLDYIRFAQKADEQEYALQYVGVGISMGLNAVLQSGCDWVDDGIFFSPFPGLDYARKHIPDFFSAAEHFEAPADDIALALWGSNAVLHRLLDRYGEVFGDDLTREDFRVLVENTQGVRSGVFPELDYTPADHFGAGSVHVLQADCAKDEYVTLETFASGF